MTKQIAWAKYFIKFNYASYSFTRLRIISWINRIHEIPKEEHATKILHGAANYCCKALHPRCLQGAWLQLCSSTFSWIRPLWVTSDALRDLVPFAQFWKREEHSCRSVTFSKVVGFLFWSLFLIILQTWGPATLLKRDSKTRSLQL